MRKFYNFSVFAAVGVSSFLAGRFINIPINGKYDSNLNTVHAKSLSIQDNDKLKADIGLPYADVATTKSARISQIMKFGFPSLDNVRSLNDFVLSYDRRNRVPNWVIEHLTAESVKFNANVDRSKCDFYEDTSVHSLFRSQNSDYKGSGYDRGHLAAAGNHRLNQDICAETFVLSNMAPQVGVGFNRGIWNSLEKYTRKLTKKYLNVYVCTGPLYLPKIEDDGLMYVKYQIIGNNHVSVPTHFFKIILLEASDHSFEVEAYVLPNKATPDDTPLTNFRVSVFRVAKHAVSAFETVDNVREASQVPPESIERASGLLFFDRLPTSNLKLINGKKGKWK